MTKQKKPIILLCISLALILVGSFFAGMFNTSFHSVKVSKIEFETERGTLTGLLYMPKGAGEDDPRPVIVTTHGYLNTKEMQDAPAIEMSRRGYIVLAMDMYDHGDSRWGADMQVGEEFGTFWVYSQFDAATYMAQQPFTKKDPDGNAYLAVSGHSMGGFSSLLALYMDEMTSLQTGTRMICAGIPVGAELSYAELVAPRDQLLAAFGSRTVGVIAGHYDEFFYNKSDEEKTDAEKSVKGSVTYKNFPATVVGKTVLGLDPNGPDGEPGRYYTVETGDLVVEGNVLRASQSGNRIIYTPNETHPWNHFSKETTGYLIGFYDEVFDGVTSPNQTHAKLPPSNQIWQWKEFFNMVSLVGFFLLMVPLVMLLLQLPFLRQSITEETPSLPTPDTSGQRFAYWLSLAVCMLIPGVFYRTLMDKRTEGLQILYVIALILFGLGVVAAVYGLSSASKQKSDQNLYTKLQSYGQGGLWTGGISLVLFLLLFQADKILTLSRIFNEPTVNQIAYWAVINGLIIALVTVIFYYFSHKPRGAAFASYGIPLKVTPIIASLVVALAAVAVGYLLLFCTQAIFGTDYRIWTLAVRTFKPEHLATALRYTPIFLVYYFVNAVALNANTRNRKAGYLVAILLNIGGLGLWLLAQYGLLFATGVSAFPDQHLNGVMLFALVPCLAIAAVYARKLYEKTNNVWVPAFLNAMLFTLINCANTAMFWNLV